MTVVLIIFGVFVLVGAGAQIADKYDWYKIESLTNEELKIEKDLCKQKQQENNLNGDNCDAKYYRNIDVSNKSVKCTQTPHTKEEIEKYCKQNETEK